MTSNIDNDINEIYGVPETYEPEPPKLLTSEDATAIATTASMKFVQATRNSTVTTKHRRSPKSRTVYRLSASSRVQKAFKTLESNIVTTKQIPYEDFELLKTAIGKYLVRLDVSNQMTGQELRMLLQTVRMEEQEAERETREAFYSTSASPPSPLSPSPSSYSYEELESDTMKYSQARERYHDLKYWRETLTAEHQRLIPCPGFGSLRTIPNIPTQHAQIAASSGVVLRHILKPETIRRKFISLKILTQKISEEVSDFLKDADRHKDRITVIKEIKDALGGGPVPQRRTRTNERSLPSESTVSKK